MYKYMRYIKYPNVQELRFDFYDKISNIKEQHPRPIGYLKSFVSNIKSFIDK